MHKSCELDLFNERKLGQALKRRENVLSKQEQQKLPQTEYNETIVQPKAKRLSSEGKLHDKNVFIWCWKSKMPKKKRKLRLLIQDDAWYSFKAHVKFIDDENLKDRLKKFIAITSDPFAVEIRYCEQCWKSYINNKNFQSVSGYGSRPGIDHIKNLFYRHINNTIFEEHEIRRLQSLRSDYVRMLNNHGLDSNVKSSYVKDLRINEFKDKIGFILNSRRNGSELVYDTAGARSYAEAIISSTGLSSEQIVVMLQSG